MFKNIISKLRSALNFFPLSNVPDGFFNGRPIYSEYGYPWGGDGRVRPTFLHHEEALTLSPFWAALRLFQTQFASLPLESYQADDEGGRETLPDKQIYNLLRDKPNNAQTRQAFFEFALKEYFITGNFYATIQWSGNHRPLAIYPVHTSQVTRVELDERWNKTFHVNTPQGEQVFGDDEMIHVFHYSHCGFRGTSFLRWACESLGLHKQVLDSATQYYQNSANPSFVMEYPEVINPQARQEIRQFMRENYQGTRNRGEIAILDRGGKVTPFANSSAADAKIIEALGASVADIARWFGISPLVLGDLSRGTYSNLAADNAAFYQRSLRPLLDKFETEISNKIHGVGSNRYSKFDVHEILRGDPTQQSTYYNAGIQGGWLLRSEIRQWEDLPFIDGLDEPLQPLNMGSPDQQQPQQQQPQQQQDQQPQETNGADQATGNEDNPDYQG